MSRKIYVHLLPSLFEPSDLRGGVAVVIDVLRASTTIVHALAAGALCVSPCQEVADAERRARELPPGTAILGGERAGTRIAGFDLDNSPLAYTPAAVAGKTVVFTTTNGTRALLRAAEADPILIGAFVNLQAVVNRLATEDRPVHLVCAGTDGQITLEDVLFAGMVAQALVSPADRANLDDATQLAIAAAEACRDRPGKVLAALRASRGGRNLIELGFDADIERAATLNLFDIVPELNLSSDGLPWIQCAASPAATLAGG